MDLGMLSNTYLRFSSIRTKEMQNQAMAMGEVKYMRKCQWT